MKRALPKKILPFAVFKFLTEFGFACGFFSTNSLLISRVGSSSLFSVYLGGSLLSLAASALFALVVDRFSRRLIFFLSFLLLGGLLTVSWVLIRSQPQWLPLYFMTRILASAVFTLTSLEFSILISLFFSHSESKQVFSLLVALSIVGEMCGGLFLHFASSIFHTENFILVWGALLILSPLFFLSTQFPTPQTPGMRTSVVWGEILSPGEERRSRSFFSSRLTLLLFIFWAAYSYFGYGTDFIFNTFAQEQIKGEDALTSFFGTVDAYSCLVILLYHLLLGPRLLQRFGIRRSLALITLLYLLPWVIFLKFPSLLTVAISQGVIYFFLDHLSVARMSSLLILFPEKVRGRIQVFTEGFGRPLGSVLLFLIACVGHFRWTPFQMALILLASALLFLCYPLLFRNPYLKHRLNSLSSRDRKLVENTIESLGEKGNSGAVAPLLTLFRAEESHALRSSIIHSLGQIQTPHSLEALSRMLQSKEESEGTQRTLLEAIGHSPQSEGLDILKKIILSQTRSDKLRQNALSLYLRHRRKKALPFLFELLNRKQVSSQILGLRGLSEIQINHPPPDFETLLSSSQARLKAAAAGLLFSLGKTERLDRERALGILRELLDSPSSVEKSSAVEMIGRLKLREFLPMLLSWNDPPPADKHFSLAVTSALAQLKDPSFAEPLLRLLLDADPGIGLLAADSWAHLPPREQKLLLRKFLLLREAQKRRILSRLQEENPDWARSVQAALSEG